MKFIKNLPSAIVATILVTTCQGPHAYQALAAQRTAETHVVPGRPMNTQIDTVHLDVPLNISQIQPIIVTDRDMLPGSLSIINLAVDVVEKSGGYSPTKILAATANRPQSPLKTLGQTVSNLFTPKSSSAKSHDAGLLQKDILDSVYDRNGIDHADSTTDPALASSYSLANTDPSSKGNYFFRGPGTPGGSDRGANNPPGSSAPPTPNPEQIKIDSFKHGIQTALVMIEISLIRARQEGFTVSEMERDLLMHIEELEKGLLSFPRNILKDSETPRGAQEDAWELLARLDIAIRALAKEAQEDTLDYAKVIAHKIIIPLDVKVLKKDFTDYKELLTATYSRLDSAAGADAASLSIVKTSNPAGFSTPIVLGAMALISAAAVAMGLHGNSELETLSGLAFGGVMTQEKISRGTRGALSLTKTILIAGLRTIPLWIGAMSGILFATMSPVAAVLAVLQGWLLASKSPELWGWLSLARFAHIVGLLSIGLGAGALFMASDTFSPFLMYGIRIAAGGALGFKSGTITAGAIKRTNTVNKGSLAPQALKHELHHPQASPHNTNWTQSPVIYGLIGAALGIAAALYLGVIFSTPVKILP